MKIMHCNFRIVTFSKWISGINIFQVQEMLKENNLNAWHGMLLCSNRGQDFH